MTITIVALMLSLVTVSFRKISERNALATAVNTLTTFASVARAYAIENRIETMLVVNPLNGRLEIWHLNPPADGGPWDPMSGGDGAVANPVNVNGYAFAPVLDSSAALPRGPDGRALVVVHPIDFDAEYAPGQPLRYDSGLTNDRANRDNLNWVAVCFDASGRLVQRMRRIATRTQEQVALVEVTVANRRTDGTPDVARVPWIDPSVSEAGKYVVDREDSLITSTRGFIVSDRVPYDTVLQPYNYEVFYMVRLWLELSRGAGGPVGRFTRHVVLSPWSGRELAVVE